MENLKKLLFLYNPRAGKEAIKGKLSDILDVFVKGGYEVTVRPTQGPGELPGLLRERAECYGLVVCSGGDGTLNEAVNGLMDCEKKPVLGYIPTGTVNDFASSLCIPKNMVAAAQNIVEGVPVTCDAGLFGDERYFTYVAAFGAFTEVSYETPQQAKNLFGRMAYFFEGMRLKHLAKYRPYEMELSYDGGTLTGNYLVGMVTNATSVAGREFSSGRDVTMNDGLLEGTFIQNPANAIELQQIINALLSQKVQSCPLIHTFQTSSFAAKAKEEVSWTLDGEYGGARNEVGIHCVKQAFQIVTRVDGKGLPPVYVGGNPAK